MTVFISVSFQAYARLGYIVWYLIGESRIVKD